MKKILALSLLAASLLSSPGNIAVSWTQNGTLLSSTNLVDWSPVPATNRTATFPGSLPQQFFRVLAEPHTVSLAWDASPSPEAVGYIVYYGTASGIYAHRVVVGAVLACTIPNLLPGTTYYFVASAYDSEGTESVPSNEIACTAPVPALSISIQ